jgi:hypothetical protein
MHKCASSSCSTAHIHHRPSLSVVTNWSMRRVLHCTFITPFPCLCLMSSRINHNHPEDAPSSLHFPSLFTMRFTLISFIPRPLWSLSPQWPSGPPNGASVWRHWTCRRSHLNYINSFVKSILGMSDEGVEIPSIQLFGNKRLVEVRVIRLMKFSLYLP